VVSLARGGSRGGVWLDRDKKASGSGGSARRCSREVEDKGGGRERVRGGEANEWDRLSVGPSYREGEVACEEGPTCQWCAEVMTSGTGFN
jgi:hypothetical protein